MHDINYNDDLREGIRPLRAEDIDRIVEIESRSFRDPWSAGFFRRCLRSGCQVWVLQRSGIVCAYAVLSLTPPAAHILNLCVDETCRRQGLGRRMLRHLIEQAGLETQAIVLEVRISNHAAIQLYRSEGFVPVGVRTSYYPSPGGGEDALVLRCQLRNDG